MKAEYDKAVQRMVEAYKQMDLNEVQEIGSFVLHEALVAMIDKCDEEDWKEYEIFKFMMGFLLATRMVGENIGVDISDIIARNFQTACNLFLEDKNFKAEMKNNFSLDKAMEASNRKDEEESKSDARTNIIDIVTGRNGK